MTTATYDEGAPGRRGVLALYEDVTPTRNDDASKFKISLRDALWLLMGCLGMYGAQVAAQYGMRSDIRDLATEFRSYQSKQSDTNNSVQRQLDEIRKESALNRVNGEEAQKEIAELKGILLGAGIKGVK